MRTHAMLLVGAIASSASASHAVDAPAPTLGAIVESLPSPDTLALLTSDTDSSDALPDPSPLQLTHLMLYWENDGAYVKRFDSSDGHYTNGLKIEATFNAPLVPAFGTWLDSWLPLGPSTTHAGSLSVAQLIFTPDDITIPDLIEDDRPYAGYLYFSLMHTRRSGGQGGSAGGVLDHTRLDVGIVGEWSGAEGLQKFVHAAVPNEPRPEGWSEQLANELGVNLTYQRRWRSRQVQITDWLAADAIPQVGFQLGNVWTNASAGATIRLGYHLPDDMGVPRISEFRDPTAITNPEHRWSLYAFARVTASAVARNIFLDGNTFADSHSVDSKPFIGDFTAGIVARYRAFEIVYSITWETETFEGQEGTDSYGTLAVSWNFDF